MTNCLLIGESGVGKSSTLELIANVLTDTGLDHYAFDILSQANEQVGTEPWFASLSMIQARLPAYTQLVFHTRRDKACGGDDWRLVVVDFNVAV